MVTTRARWGRESLNRLSDDTILIICGHLHSCGKANLAGTSTRFRELCGPLAQSRRAKVLDFVRVLCRKITKAVWLARDVDNSVDMFELHRQFWVDFDVATPQDTWHKENEDGTEARLNAAITMKNVLTRGNQTSRAVITLEGQELEIVLSGRLYCEIKTPAFSWAWRWFARTHGFVRQHGLFLSEAKDAEHDVLNDQGALLRGPSWVQSAQIALELKLLHRRLRNTTQHQDFVARVIEHELHEAWAARHALVLAP